MANPITLLLHSRKFLLLLLDTVISLALYFVSKYAAVALEDVKTLILILQPVFITIITAIAIEDASLNRQPIYVTEEELDELDDVTAKG